MPRFALCIKTCRQFDVVCKNSFGTKQQQTTCFEILLLTAAATDSRISFVIPDFSLSGFYFYE